MCIWTDLSQISLGKWSLSLSEQHSIFYILRLLHPIPKFPRSHYLLGLEKFVLLFYKIIQLKFLLREMVSVFALLPCAGS